MASPPLLDFDVLLRPISDEQPCGRDLRADAGHDSPRWRLKSARQMAQSAQREAAFDPERAASADEQWREIDQVALQTTREQSKDLIVVAFWIEALARRHGFRGLRDGLRLARELVERYWETIHPLPDPTEGLLDRLEPFANLAGDGSDGPLPSQIALMPLTEPRGDVGPFGTWHYAQARELARISDPTERDRQAQSGAVTMEVFQSAVHATSPQHLRDTAEDLEECLREWDGLHRALASHSSDAPSGSSVRDALEGALDTLRAVAGPLIEASGPASDASEDAGQTGASSGGGASASGSAKGGFTLSGSISSREDAFRALRAAAEFFRRVEPQSPVSYAIEQALRWGSMPFPELFRELLPDEHIRRDLFRLAGVRDDPPQS